MDADDKQQPASEPEATPPLAGDGRFPVIGIGASAGGLRALQAFFGHTPADTGMAFVVIVHLVPERESDLAALLRPHTAMPVTQVREDTPVAPNRIYLIPPGWQLAIDDGLLHLEPFGDPGAHRAPIDWFFRSLAESHAGRAGAAVLSGMGADGALGL